MELQVEEDPPARGRQGLDGGRAGPGEEFEADLDDPEPGVEPLGEPDRGGEVVDVEGQGEAVAACRRGVVTIPDLPTRSAPRATPWPGHQRAKSSATCSAARGSKNVAVPTPTAAGAGQEHLDGVGARCGRRPSR